MRVLASADHHFDEHSDRWNECLRVHDWMVEHARAEQVDLFLSGGDIYERESTPLERQAVADWLTRMAEVCPVVIAKGNHDRHLDCEILGRLRTRHPIIVEERAAVHYVGGAAIATVAWPDRGVLLGQLKGSEETNLAMREALQDLLRGLGHELGEHDGPRILLGHFMIDGSVTSTGQPLLGQPINVGLSDLMLAGAHLTVAGHIHRAHRFDIGSSTPILYAGSPFRTDFGQTEDKTVVLADFDGPSLVRLREIETPAAKMVHLHLEWDPDGFFKRDGLPVLDDQWPDLSNTETRLRYDVPVDQREAAARAAEALADSLKRQGAALVKLDPQVVVERRARAPEVARAQGIADKLEAYWRSIAFEPGDRREALLRKAVGLEEEARNAA